VKAQIRLVFILLMILAVAPCARAATTDLLLARPAGMQAQANGGKVMHAMSLNPNAFNMAPGSSATLSIPGRAAYQIVFERIEFHASGNRTWVGFLKDHGDDFRVFLTTGVGGSSGSINTPDGQYRFDAVDADGWLLDIKASGLVPPVSASPDYLLPAGEPLAAAALQHAAAAPPATSSVIDLLVLYPVSMTTRYGSQLQSRLDTLVTLTNQALPTAGSTPRCAWFAASSSPILTTPRTMPPRSTTSRRPRAPAAPRSTLYMRACRRYGTSTAPIS